MIKKIAVDFFKDELLVGKEYVFMLRSRIHYLAIAKVVSIEYEPRKEYDWNVKARREVLVPIVKVERQGKIFKYNHTTGKGHYEPCTYIKRIWNWESAVPVPEGK